MPRGSMMRLLVMQCDRRERALNPSRQPHEFGRGTRRGRTGYGPLWRHDRTRKESSYLLRKIAPMPVAPGGL